MRLALLKVIRCLHLALFYNILFSGVLKYIKIIRYIPSSKEIAVSGGGVGDVTR